MPPIDPDELTLYRLYRDRVFQEYDLINHRMMWMVLSQAFMLALWTGMPERPFGLRLGDLRWPMLMVAVGGVVLTLASALSIRAAQQEIATLRARYRAQFQAADDPHARDSATPFGDPRLPNLTGSRQFHLLGHLAPWCMLACLSILWITLCAVSALHN